MSSGLFLVKVWTDQREAQNIWAFNRNSKLEKWLMGKRQIPPNSRFWFECHSYALKWPDWKSCVISVNTRVQSPRTGCYKRYLNSMPFAVVPFLLLPHLSDLSWSCDCVRLNGMKPSKEKFLRLLERSLRNMYWELCNWKGKCSFHGHWNPRIPEMGWHLWRSPNPTPYLE